MAGTETEVIVKESSLQNIANAIREKNGKTDKYKPSEMSAAISEISKGFPNGMEWTKSNIVNDNFNAIYYANNLRVAGSNNGLYYSTDGKTWTQSNITNLIYTVYYANDTWFAGGNNILCYSTDGQVWTRNSLDIPGGDFITILYVNGLWIASDELGRRVFCSENKYSKECFIINYVETYFEAIYYANKLYVGGSNKNGLYYSTNGKEWIRSNITSGNFNSICYANGLWVTSGSNGLYYSTDGKNWTQSNIINYFRSVYYANGIWVACSDLGLYYSINGKFWIQSSIVNGYFNTVYNANGIWVVGSDEGLYYSVTWEPDPPLIGFWIDDQLVKAPEGMMWEEFVNSSYNTFGLTLKDTSNYVWGINSGHIIADDGIGTSVKKKELIKCNMSYSINTSTPPVEPPVESPII